MGSPINSHYNIRGQQSITRLNTLNLLYLFSQMGRDRAQLKTYIYMKQSPFSFFPKCALVKKRPENRDLSHCVGCRLLLAAVL